MSREFLNLDELPHINCNCIDWKKSVGKELSFIYDDVCGVLHINKRVGSKIEVQYENRTKLMLPGKLLCMQIKDLIGLRPTDYIYDIEDIITYNDGNQAKIIKKYYGKHNARTYDLFCFSCRRIFTRTQPELLRTTRVNGCPICQNKTHKKIVKGVNDMWTTDPDLAEQLLDPEDGYKYSALSTVMLNWKCKICGEPHDGKMLPRTVLSLNRIAPCKSCSDGFSFPNKLMYNILVTSGINFKAEATFDWSQGRRYDFHLIDQHILIEMMGKQHYIQVAFGDLGDIQKNDAFKKELAIQNGYSNEQYLQIDCIESDAQYIINNLKKTILNTIINFDDLDIESLVLLSANSIIERVIQLVGEGYNGCEIAKQLGISDITAYRYIKIGEQSGLLRYDKNYQRQRKYAKLSVMNKQRCCIPLLCVDTNEAFASSPDTQKNWKLIHNEFIDSTKARNAARNNTTYKNYNWRILTKAEYNVHKDQHPDKAFGDYFILEEKQNTA